MANKLPPTPLGVPPGHVYWNQWYEQLRNLVNNANITVTWNNIDFTGSNITDISNRAHNNLTGFQGGSAGEYYHLTNAQHTEATAARSTRGVDTTDYVIIDDATKGVVLKDTAGTPHYWLITVDTAGVLTTTDLGTTKP